MAFSGRFGRDLHVTDRATVHHAQQVLELRIVAGISLGVVVDEDVVVGCDESVGVLRQDQKKEDLLSVTLIMKCLLEGGKIKIKTC